MKYQRYEPGKAPSRLRKVLVWVGIGIIALLPLVVLASFFIDEPLRRYVENQLNSKVEGFQFKIGKLSLHPLACSVDLKDLTVAFKEHADPPLVQIKKWNMSIHFFALFLGRIESDHRIERPILQITRAQIEQEAKKNTKKKAAPAAASELQDAIAVDEFSIVDGDVTYADGGESKPLELREINLRTQHLWNMRSKKQEAYPTDIHFDAVVFDTGKLALDGQADLMAKPSPALKTDILIDQIQLGALSPVLERYNMELRQGTLSARGHVEYTSKTKLAEMQELTLQDVQMDFIHKAETEGKEKAAAKKAGDAVEETNDNRQIQIRLAHGAVINSEFGMVNQAASNPYRIFMGSTNIQLENVSNRLDKGTAVVKLTGLFMGQGTTRIDGDFEPEMNGPDFHLDVQLEPTPLTSLNDVLRSHAKLDVVDGTMSVYSEMQVKDGRIKGYVKPLFNKVDVYDKDQDSDKNVFQKVYEGVVGGIAKIFENHPRKEVATKVGVKGPVKDPEISTWELVINLFQNAFFDAILPGLEQHRSSH